MSRTLFGFAHFIAVNNCARFVQILFLLKHRDTTPINISCLNVNYPVFFDFFDLAIRFPMSTAFAVWIPKKMQSISLAFVLALIFNKP
jgi:hypothetical protein